MNFKYFYKSNSIINEERYLNERYNKKEKVSFIRECLEDINKKLSEGNFFIGYNRNSTLGAIGNFNGIEIYGKSLFIDGIEHIPRYLFVNSLTNDNNINLGSAYKYPISQGNNRKTQKHLIFVRFSKSFPNDVYYQFNGKHSSINGIKDEIYEITKSSRAYTSLIVNEGEEFVVLYKYLESFLKKLDTDKQLKNDSKRDNYFEFIVGLDDTLGGVPKKLKDVLDGTEMKTLYHELAHMYDHTQEMGEFYQWNKKWDDRSHEFNSDYQAFVQSIVAMIDEDAVDGGYTPLEYINEIKPKSPSDYNSYAYKYFSRWIEKYKNKVIKSIHRAFEEVESFFQNKG